MKKTSTALAKNVLGPKIREIRLKTTPPVSQEDLCARLEVRGIRLNQSALSRLENQDRYLMDYELIEIAKALKVPVNKFFEP